MSVSCLLPRDPLIKALNCDTCYNTSLKLPAWIHLLGISGSLNNLNTPYATCRHLINYTFATLVFVKLFESA